MEAVYHTVRPSPAARYRLLSAGQFDAADGSTPASAGSTTAGPVARLAAGCAAQMPPGLCRLCGSPGGLQRTMWNAACFGCSRVLLGCAWPLWSCGASPLPRLPTPLRRSWRTLGSRAGCSRSQQSSAGTLTGGLSLLLATRWVQAVLEPGAREATQAACMPLFTAALSSSAHRRCPSQKSPLPLPLHRPQTTGGDRHHQRGAAVQAEGGQNQSGMGGVGSGGAPPARPGCAAGGILDEQLIESRVGLAEAQAVGQPGPAVSAEHQGDTDHPSKRPRTAAA